MLVKPQVPLGSLNADLFRGLPADATAAVGGAGQGGAGLGLTAAASRRALHASAAAPVLTLQVSGAPSSLSFCSGKIVELVEYGGPSAPRPRSRCSPSRRTPHHQRTLFRPSRRADQAGAAPRVPGRVRIHSRLVRV